MRESRDRLHPRPLTSGCTRPTSGCACWGEWRRAIREAVSALYERYGALLLGAAVRIVHSQAEAEDAFSLSSRCPSARGIHAAERGRVTAWLINLLTRTPVWTGCGAGPGWPARP